MSNLLLTIQQIGLLLPVKVKLKVFILWTGYIEILVFISEQENLTILCLVEAVKYLEICSVFDFNRDKISQRGCQIFLGA